MVTVDGCGYAMGSSSGGFLSSYLIPEFGWPAQFYVASGADAGDGRRLVGLPSGINPYT